MTNMIPQKVVERVLELRKEILKHNYLYYVLDSQEISNEEWDSLYYELVDLEEQYPELVTPDSPTQKVGADTLSQLSTYKHQNKLLSLDKISYDRDKLRQWIINTYNDCLSLGYEVDFVLEQKIDGLTTIHNYISKNLELSATRGNGIVGENVTSNTKTIGSVPQKILFDGELSVHGEVYMPKSVFEEINRFQIENGKKEFANTRNLAAGSLRQLDSNICASRRLEYFAYQINYIENVEFEKHSDSLEFLTSQGFTVPEYKVYSFSQLEELLDDCVGFSERRDDLDYDIDGMVIKVNNLKCRELLGSTSKYPKWAIAYKFPPEIKETVIEDITIQIGRTGTINFVASLSPIRLEGTTVSNATLHNIDFINKKDIRIGDTVKVFKGGQIIPVVLEVVLEKRKNGTEKYTPPVCCPACGNPLVYSTEEVAIRCDNPDCKPQLVNRISHYASKNAMDISFLAEKVSMQLIDNNLIQNVSDLYYLNKESLLTLDKFKDKKADNLLNAIEKSKTKGLASLLFGLGIRNVGKENAILIAEHFGNIDSLMQANAEEINSIPQIGEVIAVNVVNFFNSDHVIHLINRMKDAGVVMEQPKEEASTTKFKNLTFVITGTLSQSRQYFADVIKKNGGKVSGSVSAKTSYVLVGEDAGSKLDEAQKLVEDGKMQQNQILNEEIFNSLLSQ